MVCRILFKTPSTNKAGSAISTDPNLSI
jgi:hypothetical protein